MVILLKFRRRCNDFPSAAVRSPDFGELAAPGQPTGRVSRCPLLAISGHSEVWILMSAFPPKADIWDSRKMRLRLALDVPPLRSIFVLSAFLLFDIVNRGFSDRFGG